jgi:hypothetical protein
VVINALIAVLVTRRQLATIRYYAMLRYSYPLLSSPLFPYLLSSSLLFSHLPNEESYRHGRQPCHSEEP